MNIFHQNVFDRWPLPDKSVQTIVTSPPYWGLRKYDIPDVVIGGEPGCEHQWGPTKTIKRDRQHLKELGERLGCGGGKKHSTDADKFNGDTGSYCVECGAWKGQYGLEPSFRLFIEHTLLWVEEAWRVLKDDGVFFLNMGDSYASGKGSCYNPGGGKNSLGKSVKEGGAHPMHRGNLSDLKRDGVRPKTKLLMPHRVAIELVDAGWTLRNDIVWYKPNSMPESTLDRFSKKWEAVFMFSKRERYFFDLDAVREPHSGTTLERAQRGRKGVGIPRSAMPGQNENTPMPDSLQKKGKNPGDMWTITNQPSPFPHYAMWPEALVGRMVKCSTRHGDKVLDPFCGSATTLRVASELGREGIGIDLGYEDIQRVRLSNIQGKLAVVEA